MSQSSEPERRQRSLEVDSGKKKENVLTVTQVTTRIKSLLENSLGDLWVKGEISNLSKPRSGHVYFSLKDDENVLPVALFRRAHKKVEFDLEDGLEVRVRGKISAYTKRGQYQIIAKKVLPLGEGALQLAFKQLKEKLQKEGLFKDEHKKPLPALPETIAVVTSPTGAAVRDMVRTIHNRYPPVHILVVPVKVQGDDAKEQIARAIELVNENRLADVIITGRGGGSLEDLWAFNEEIVARAIFHSEIPIISAVGHEVDRTISDLVADARAATPTEAGQIVVPKLSDLLEKLQIRHDRATRRLRRILQKHGQTFQNAKKAVLRAHPDKQLERNRSEFLQKGKSILREMDRVLEQKKEKFESISNRLESLSPLNVLKRGYSITREAKSDKILKTTEPLKEGDEVITQLSEGTFRAEVTEVEDA